MQFSLQTTKPNFYYSADLCSISLVRVLNACYRTQVSTTIGPSAGVLVMVVSLKVLEKKFDTRGVNNGILSGLVAITAGAPLVNPEGAFVIGVFSAGVYYTSANLLLKLRIDDVVDAVSGRVPCGVVCLCLFLFFFLMFGLR